MITRIIIVILLAMLLGWLLPSAGEPRMYLAKVQPVSYQGATFIECDSFRVIGNSTTLWIDGSAMYIDGMNTTFEINPKFKNWSKSN